MSELPKSILEKITELLKAILWPVIVIFLIALFWKPISLTADKLPDMIAKSESVTIGSLSIKLNDKVSSPPSEDVKKALADISEEALFELMDMSGSKGQMIRYNSGAWYDGNMNELLEKRLIVEFQCDTTKYSIDDHCFKPTQAGMESHKYLRKIVKALVDETKK